MGRPVVEALADRPLFFEPVPPSARAPSARVEAQFAATAALVSAVGRVDAVNVPELVDENHDGRPYYRSGDVRWYARRLADATSTEPVVNKVVAHLPSAPATAAWAEETVARGVRSFVLVGGSSRYIPYPGPDVAEANRLCRTASETNGGALGNIAIPQRAGEAHRMLAKTRAGARFFTTQIAFDATASARLVREYDLLCRQSGLPPAAVVVSVAPLADEADAEFVRWLGADLPEPTERAILSGEERGAVGRSVDRALALWEEVRRAAAEAQAEVPLGVNVEQLSQRHLESAAEMLRAFATAIDART
jgi:5,10-methylenetetrahydrofolate reductase